MDLLLPDPEYVHILPGTAMLRWSPRIWGALHGLSFLYPHLDMHPLLQALSKGLPCMVCAYHLTSYLKKTPPDIGSTVPLYWFEYIVGLHNDVNERRQTRVWCLVDILEVYRRTQKKNPSHFRQSVHDRAWQTLWFLLLSSDLRVTSGLPRDRLSEIDGWMHTVGGMLDIPSISLPSEDTCDPDKPLTIQCITSLIQKWSMETRSARSTHVPEPIRWWIDHISTYPQVHICAHVLIEKMKSGDSTWDPDMLVTIFLEDLMGVGLFLRISESPLDHRTWCFLEKMVDLRQVLTKHPAPAPYVYPMTIGTAPSTPPPPYLYMYIGAGAGLVCGILSVVLVVGVVQHNRKSRRTVETVLSV